MSSVHMIFMKGQSTQWICILFIAIKINSKLWDDWWGHGYWPQEIRSFHSWHFRKFSVSMYNIELCNIEMKSWRCYRSPKLSTEAEETDKSWSSMFPLEISQKSFIKNWSQISEGNWEVILVIIRVLIYAQAATHRAMITIKWSASG